MRVFAPAKLTLSLRIVGIRDDGFHLIDAEMVTLDFGDDLEIRAVDGARDAIATGDAANDGSMGGGARSGQGRVGRLQMISELARDDATGSDDERGSPAMVVLGEDDLVARALVVCGRDADVTLTKRIPPGGGLGGGSADAAAVLRWAGFVDHVAAGRLGADIPFCMVGGRARVRGIGEIVEPLPFEPRELTLLTPPFGCSTPAVYRRWDQLGGPTGEHGNDLEPAALAVEPALARWRDVLGDASGVQPRLAGSGSTWFVEGHHDVRGGRQVTTTPTPAVGRGL